MIVKSNLILHEGKFSVKKFGCCLGLVLQDLVGVVMVVVVFNLNVILVI